MELNVEGIHYVLLFLKAKWDMDYRQVYKNLICIAKTRNANLDTFELHHIKPKCCGGSNDKHNLVKLSFREHYLAHKLLVRIHPSNKHLAKALWMMTITTIASLGGMKNHTSDYRLRNRMASITKDKKSKITTRDYEFSKRQYAKHMLGHEVSAHTKKLISVNTRFGMQSKDIIAKCSLGSKNSRHYYDKNTMKGYKWHLGDPEIDTTKYAYGRPPMSIQQKQKLSDIKKLNKTRYHNDDLELNIDIYNDYIAKIPYRWEIGNKIYKNNTVFKSLLKEIKAELLNYNIFFNAIFTYTPKEISKQKRIVNPAFFEIFHEMLLNWKLNKSVVKNIVEYVKDNLAAVEKEAQEFLRR